MLANKSKVYYVYEYGEEWESPPIGVCSTLELAQELKTLTDTNSRCVIPKNEFIKMNIQLYDYEKNYGEISEDVIEGLVTLFPKYSREDLEIAEKKYYTHPEIIGVGIKEIDFYK